MESNQSEESVSSQSVEGLPVDTSQVPNWTEVTVVGGCDTARAGVYQVAVAGLGGIATFKDGGHGVVAVASNYGHAISGDGGVAVSSGEGVSHVEKWGYAYSKGGLARAGSCSVAGTAGGYAMAVEHGIGIGWFHNTRGAKVEAGDGGVAIGDLGCFVKVGEGGVLIAMADPALDRPTKFSLVGQDGIVAGQWYRIEVDHLNVFKFAKAPSPPEWKESVTPCIVPPKP